MSDELAGVRAGDFNEQKPLPTVEQAIEAAVKVAFRPDHSWNEVTVEQAIRIVAAAARLEEHDHPGCPTNAPGHECDYRAELVADLRREMGDE